jgi:hypothetical protein
MFSLTRNEIAVKTAYSSAEYAERLLDNLKPHEKSLDGIKTDGPTFPSLETEPSVNTLV